MLQNVRLSLIEGRFVAFSSLIEGLFHKKQSLIEGFLLSLHQKLMLFCRYSKKGTIY